MGARRWSATTRVVVALFFGLFLGLAISASRSLALLSASAALETVGTLWINAIRMTVIPLVVSLLFVSMTSFPDGRAAGRMGARSLMIFAALLLGTTALAILLVPPLFAWLPTGPATAGSVGSMTNPASVAQQAQQLPSIARWLTDAVPTNPFRAAADGAMLPLVVFSIAFGLAALHIGEELRAALVAFFRAVSEAMQVLVRWLVALAPIGVFCLILPLASRMGASALGAFGYYVVALSGLLILLTLAFYPIAAVFGRVSVGRFTRAAFPAQTVAVSSRSSLASLPALIEGAEQYLPCPSLAAGFVLPLAVSIFKVNTPVVWLAGACFVARVYGVHVGAIEVGEVATAGFLLSFCAPGIPMGSLILLAPVFSSVGLPAEGIGILIAVDLIPDIFKTVSNVTGDMTAAAMLSRQFQASGQAPQHENEHTR
jgi:proton glutamate symport protein